MAQPLKSSIKLPPEAYVKIPPTQKELEQQISSAVNHLLQYSQEHQMTLPQMQDVCINLQLWVFGQMKMLVQRAMKDKPKEESKIVLPK